MNFRGLRGHQNAIPEPETGMTVTVASRQPMQMYYVPFLGEKQELQGERRDDEFVFHLPRIDRGGDVRLEVRP